MSIWHKPITLEQVNARSENTMMTHLDIHFTEIGDDYLVATMPVDHRTRQPLGILHGGASCVLAETIGSTAANMVIDLDKTVCVGLSINTSHIRSIREGLVIGKAIAEHIGRSTQVWQIHIHNEQSKLISSTKLTMAVLQRK